MTHRFHPHDEPDPQSLLDFGDAITDGTAGVPANELEATMLRVQRGLHATSLDHDTMPDDVRTRIREELMHVAAPPADIAGSQPSVPRPKARRRRPSTPAPRPHMPRMAWSGGANIALAVMILVAAFGAWRFYDDSFGGTGGNTPGEGQYAYAPVISTPAATASAAVFACDFSQDVPIIPDVSQSPVDGTSLYLTPRNDGTGELTGSLMLHCPEEPEDIELAKNVLNAIAGPWGGIIRLSVLPEGSTDPADQYPSYLNIETNQHVAFGTGDNQRYWVQAEQGSPWIVGPSLNDLSVTHVVDLRTMEVRRLDDLSGMPMPDKKMVMLSTPANDGTVALGYSGNQYDLRLSRDTGAPGDLLILGTSFNDSHWITLDDSIPVVSDVKLSPDASKAALKLNIDTETNAYAIVSADEGSEVVRSGNLPRVSNPFLSWVQHGTAVAYAGPSSLEVLPAESGAQPKTVLEVDQDLKSVRITSDAGVLVATTHADHGADTDSTSTEMDKVYAVNLSNGDTHEFQGMELGNKIPSISSTNALLMYDDSGPESGTITVRVYDPVSGALVQEIAGIPDPDSAATRAIGKSSFAASADGHVEIYAIGTQNIIVVQTQGNAPVVRQLDTPTETSGMASIIVSPDGTMLSLVNRMDESRISWIFNLAAPSGIWIAVPNEMTGTTAPMIQFVSSPRK